MGYLGTKPANAPLTSELIPDGLIATSDIADNAITTAKIAAGAVVQADLAAGVAGNGPAFSAYANGTQTLTNGVNTKITMNVEEFDTNNNYDPTTNFRFTPSVAGYYQVSGSIGLAIVSTSVSVIPYIYKNGSVAKQGVTAVSSSNSYPYGTVSALVYCNGTTDYLEFYALSAGATVSTWSGAASNNYFQAAMVRAV